MIKLQAHRGVSSDFPENTMLSFEAAVRLGYEVIELDVSPTKDLRFVLLHDNKVNRTGRQPDGSPIPEEHLITDLTYEQALEYDFGLWKGEEFRGTKIPLFSDVLKLVDGTGITLKIDNKYQRFTDTEKAAFFDLLEPWQRVAGLTCSRLDTLQEAVSRFPEMVFHYDGPVSEDILNELSGLLPPERLIVWIPYQNARTSWVKVGFADEKLAAQIREYARLGVWLLSDPAELRIAEQWGAEVAETNGDLKPYMR